MDEPFWPDGKAPKDFWKNPDHRRWYMGWLGEQLGYRAPDDWYQITELDFQAHQGGELLAQYYQSSPALAVKSHFPKFQWHEWLFDSLPDDFWEYADHRQRYLRWLGEQLGYQADDDWYQLTARDFAHYHGEELLRDYYRDSLLAALQECFPGHGWHEWLFEIVPQSLWDDPDNRRRYMQWLGEQRGYRTTDDWYQLTEQDFRQHHGKELLRDYYDNSPIAAVRELWPGQNWQAWRFRRQDANVFWKDVDLRREYLTWLGEQLGYYVPDDWYHISKDDFDAHNGGDLFSNYYQESPAPALRDYLPEYDWKEWFFDHLPATFWFDWNQRQRYMVWLGEQLDYQAPDDWYAITAQDFESHQGRQLLEFYQRAVSVAVLDTFPENEWQPERFGPNRKQCQQMIDIVNKVFPGYDLKTNEIYKDVQFDLAIPSLNLAFDCQREYQGLPFSELTHIPGLKRLRQRDKKNVNICRKCGLTRIELPCDWDGDEKTALDLFAQQFVQQVNGCRKWAEHIRLALAALTAYRRKQCRKQRKQSTNANQQQLNFLPLL